MSLRDINDRRERLMAQRELDRELSSEEHQHKLRFISSELALCKCGQSFFGPRSEAQWRFDYHVKSILTDLEDKLRGNT